MGLQPWGRGAFPTLPGHSSPQELSGENKKQPPGFRAPLEGGRAGGRPPTGLSSLLAHSQGGCRPAHLHPKGQALSGEHVLLEKAVVFRVGFALGSAWDTRYGQPFSESLLSLHTGQGSRLLPVLLSSSTPSSSQGVKGKEGVFLQFREVFLEGFEKKPNSCKSSHLTLRADCPGETSWQPSVREQLGGGVGVPFLGEL